MPRFFYHMTDGTRTFTDANGVELRNTAEARKFLISHVRKLKGSLNEQRIQDWSHWTVVLEDEKNKPLFEMSFDLKPKVLTA